MSFPSYQDYKDTGVEWLGETPADWKLWRLADLFAEVSEGGTITCLF